MYLVFVDFSDNNSLLTEQLNVRSFYDLSILNKLLPEVQLTNFADCDIQGAFLFDSEKTIEFPLFTLESIGTTDFKKKLYEFDNQEKVLLIRNNIYFECGLGEYKKSHQGNDMLAFTDKEGYCYGVLTSVRGLIRKLNQNLSFKDLFYHNEKLVDIQIVPGGYTKPLNSVKDYKYLLFDILNGKTSFKPPHIAEGIFTENTVPENDFSIIPPVYLGESVQIESGSVIGPNTIIFNNTLISSDTSIKNSILFEDVYVSSHCYINGAICCKNSSIKRNSAVFGDSVIGENSLVGEDMLVENDSVINKNVRFDKFIKSPFTEKMNNIFHSEFNALSPEKSALLGSAIGIVLKKPRVLLASDGSPKSLAIKLALMSGLILSGAECFDIGVAFKSFIFFGLSYCECDYSIFIRDKNGGTDIEIFNSENIPISKTDCCNLFNFCNEGKLSFAKQSACKPVRQIHGLRRMYIQEITCVFTENIENFPVINCENDMILKLFEEIKAKTEGRHNKKEKLFVNIDASGSKVGITFKGKAYSEKTLKKLVHFYFKKAQNNIEHLNDYYKMLWKNDNIFLVFSVIYIVEKTKRDISTLINELPAFFVETKAIKANLKVGDFARKFSVFNDFSCKNNAYNISLKNGLVRVIKSDNTNNLKICCASSDLSVSKEICDFISFLINTTDA